MIDLSAFSSLVTVELGQMKDKPTTLTPGQKEVSRELWKSADGRVKIGLWECTAGRFTADRSQAAEFCHFLTGRILMTYQDGTKRELGPGDAILLPRGWKGEWEILNCTRKIYVLIA